MALQSQLKIFIGGTAITAFKTFRLHQEIDSHHDFRLVCRADVLENLSGEMASETKNFLGESFILQVGALGFTSGYKELEFKGVVTSVDVTKGFLHSGGDTIAISGKSSCIISDDGPHYASHNDVSMLDILQKTYQGYDISKLETVFNPVKTETIHYSVQQNESSYQYLSRLAAQYSEWFYYDGKKLVFGSAAYDTVPLQYGMDLQEFSLKLAPKPNKYRYFTNDYITDQQHEKSTNEVNTGVNGFNQFTSEKSNTLYAKETSVYINSYDDAQLKNRLDTQVEQQTKAIEAKQVIVKGSSDNPGVSLGDVVTIQDGLTGYGSFRIIKVTHTVSENGKYNNEFEGITAELDVYPKTDMMSFPKSDTQVATVIENVDPDGISRIRVQFPWQKPYGELTPWLRVVSPHAGGEKGFHFIPEKGEEVLVGFEGGNAERPYVMGSMYTGGAQPGAFQSDNNDIKAIQSRSGNRVIMNDKDGSITMADPSGNVVVMQGNGEIVIKAPKKLTLMSTDINILAGNSINIEAKPNEDGGEGTIGMKAQKSFGLKVVDETIGVSAKKDITLTSETASTNLNGKTDTNIKGETSINLDGDKINVKGGSKIKVESSDTDIF